jgi:N-acetylneuraminic acid mutarotase
MQQLVLAAFAFVCLAAAEIPDLPDKEGFAGPYAGVSGGALIVAGGANFPDKKPWEGGTKVWYDSIFVLDKPDGKWIATGKLPRPLGYGVSVTWNENVVCVGGSDATRHYADVFAIKWAAGKIQISQLPALPKALANMCGVVARDRLYIVGGIESPKATDAFTGGYCLDLSAKDAKWETLPQCPAGGRMLALAAAIDGDLFIAGGVSLTAAQDGEAVRHYRKDAWGYSPAAGWKQLADLPNPVAAAPSPAPNDASGFFVVGFDDGAQIHVDPKVHKGFNRSVLKYELKSGKWSRVGELDVAAVTTTCVRWNDAWIIPNGEVKPGVRTNKVARWNAMPRPPSPAGRGGTRQ